MKKSILKLIPITVIVCSLFIQCNKSEEISDEQLNEITDKAMFNMDETMGTGKQGCFELIFPVSVTLPDGNVKTFASYQEIGTEVKARIRARASGGGRPGGTGRPQGDRPHPKLVLPVNIITEDGKAVTISTEEEMKALRKSCGSTFFAQGNHSGYFMNSNSCFQFEFPISVKFPDGTTQAATSKEELKSTIQTWKQNNTNASSRPEIVFPIQVKKADGNVVNLTSREEFRTLRQSCK